MSLPPAPGPFSMASPERTTSLLRNAGFGGVQLEEVAVRFVVPDIDEYLQSVADTSGPLALAMRALPQPDRDAMRNEIGEALSRFTTGDGYEIPGVAQCAAGR